MEADKQAHEDDRATEPPGQEEQGPGDRHDDSASEGGPYGNPEVDEEALRKRQEEARRRRREDDD